MLYKDLNWALCMACGGRGEHSTWLARYEQRWGCATMSRADGWEPALSRLGVSGLGCLVGTNWPSVLDNVWCVHLEQPYERVAAQGSLVGLVCGFCAGDV